MCRKPLFLYTFLAFLSDSLLNYNPHWIPTSANTIYISTIIKTQHCQAKEHLYLKLIFFFMFYFFFYKKSNIYCLNCVAGVVSVIIYSGMACMWLEQA